MTTNGNRRPMLNLVIYSSILALIVGASIGQGLEVSPEAEVTQALESGSTLDLRSLDIGDPQPLRIPLDEYLAIAAEHPQGHGSLAPNHLDFNGIRPGQGILVNIPGEGTFICSISFIFENPKTGELYAGTAGHCLLPSSAVATDNEGSNNYDPSGVNVHVCRSNCITGGFLSGFGWTTEWLGPVEYARQSDGARPGCPAGSVGNDFGLIKIREELYPHVNPAMAVWHGPHNQAGLAPTGQTLVHYGNGVTAGSTSATAARVATGLNDGIVCSWQAIGHIYGGDSGSAISFGGTSQGLVLHGEHALGTVTHTLGIGVAFGTPALGTTVFSGLDMAKRDAGLDLVLVEP